MSDLKCELCDGKGRLRRPLREGNNPRQEYISFQCKKCHGAGYDVEKCVKEIERLRAYPVTFFCPCGATGETTLAEHESGTPQICDRCREKLADPPDCYGTWEPAAKRCKICPVGIADACVEAQGKDDGPGPFKGLMDDMQL